jgi:hypothetical protein
MAKRTVIGHDAHDMFSMANVCVFSATATASDGDWAEAELTNDNAIIVLVPRASAAKIAFGKCFTCCLLL